MLITTRTYSASQIANQTQNHTGCPSQARFTSLTGWKSDPSNVARRGTEMLLIRQVGSVCVGEVIRYTLTYEPAADTSHPYSTALHLKIKNTSPIPLRAAYLHGPYTLYASCYPSSFNPNKVSGSPAPDTDNIPQFEPYLKAGGTWNAEIPIPRHAQQGHGTLLECSRRQSTTWIIEIISQVVFSSTASVNFEVLVASDKKSLDLSPQEGRSKPPKGAHLREHWPLGSTGRQFLATKGVFSDSITLLIDDTASLWNTPHLPVPHNDRQAANANLESDSSVRVAGDAAEICDSTPSTAHTKRQRPRRRVHLVVLTHGLHSNLGADMLYLKESIDAAVAQNTPTKPQDPEGVLTPENSSSNGYSVEEDIVSQEEQVIVRGFPGNAARTERGIQYLGKRLAKYVLLMTYPDQPHLPRKKAKTETYSGPFSRRAPVTNDAKAEASCTDAERSACDEHHAYKITSISFIGHSLGGLVQTYAIAYIQKHSPDFFDKIRPINFIALATPFLGISNENPVHVRFALDFGLVGRTGQDLGLSWTAPKVRSGWETMIGGKGESSRYQGNADARTKPLLRILPSGPAHEVLSKFKHRTIYSNLVNDGIVPLRTSCLLFLDWKGLERVEKTRRENGIVGTMVEWGWAELTGANSKYPITSGFTNGLEATGDPKSTTKIIADNTSSPRVVTAQSISGSSSASHIWSGPPAPTQPLYDPGGAYTDTELDSHTPHSPSSPLGSLFSMFRPRGLRNKQLKILKRSQTLATPIASEVMQQDDPSSNHSTYDLGFNAPPQTTVFESAGDILMPPLPPMAYILNPALRPRTILHDRVYLPEDIPDPVTKRSAANIDMAVDETAANNPSKRPSDETGLKVEEKIARAYHRELSWRKVLVRLEPDAHNNIIVRRMFANAYGWPVVQHLVDTHFGSSSSHDLGDNHDAPREFSCH
ncbi:putative serine esterase-domain-containing protein [Aspergillus californicus]